MEGAASPDGADLGSADGAASYSWLNQVSADLGSADGAASYKIHLVKAGGGWRGLRPPMVPTSDRRTEPPPTKSTSFWAEFGIQRHAFS